MLPTRRRQIICAFDCSPEHSRLNDGLLVEDLTGLFLFKATQLALALEVVVVSNGYESQRVRLPGPGLVGFQVTEALGLGLNSRSQSDTYFVTHLAALLVLLLHTPHQIRYPSISKTLYNTICTTSKMCLHIFVIAIGMFAVIGGPCYACAKVDSAATSLKIGRTPESKQRKHNHRYL